MHRAFVSDFQQLGALLFAQAAADANGANKLVNLGRSRGESILRMDLVMRDIDADALKRPAFAARIHTDGHRSAGPEARGDKAIGGHAAIGAAIGQGLIRIGVMMGAGLDILQEPRRIGLGDPQDTFGGTGGGGLAGSDQYNARPRRQSLRLHTLHPEPC